MVIGEYVIDFMMENKWELCWFRFFKNGMNKDKLVYFKLAKNHESMNNQAPPCFQDESTS